MEKIEVNSERWLSLEDLEGEIWEFVPDTQEMYSISNYGRFRRNPRYFNIGDGIDRFLKATIRKLSKNRQGYWGCNYSIDGKRKSVRINILVANAFIPNPHNYPIINHIDEDKGNNYYTNLEHCTYSYNSLYGEGYKSRCNNIRKTKFPTRHTIKQYTFEGEFVSEYKGYKEVEKAGFNGIAVLNCCEHRSQCSAGYVWRFEDDPFDKPVYTYDPANSKRVEKYDLNMNFIATYKSLSEAARSVGVKNRDSIRLCCINKRQKAHGFIWKYKEE